MKIDSGVGMGGGGKPALIFSTGDNSVLSECEIVLCGSITSTQAWKSQQ